MFVHYYFCIAIFLYIFSVSLCLLFSIGKLWNLPLRRECKSISHVFPIKADLKLLCFIAQFLPSVIIAWNVMLQSHTCNRYTIDWPVHPWFGFATSITKKCSVLVFGSHLIFWLLNKYWRSCQIQNIIKLLKFCTSKYAKELGDSGATAKLVVRRRKTEPRSNQ